MVGLCQNLDTTTQETTPSPSHPLAIYALTRQTQQFSVKEMEKKKLQTRGRFFPPQVLFTSVHYYWLINNKLFLIFKPIEHQQI